jgi:hypothetical protein
MGFSEKAKAKALIVVLLAVLLFSVFRALANQAVEVLYYTSPACILTRDSDQTFDEIQRDFGDRVMARKIVVDLEGNGTESVNLKDEYGIYGVPTFVVDGEISKTSDVKIDICRNFIIKPEACEGWL